MLERIFNRRKDIFECDECKNREFCPARLGKTCIICGEAVEFTPNEEMAFRREYPVDSKVCDKCRQAILYVRNQMIGDKE